MKRWISLITAAAITASAAVIPVLAEDHTVTGYAGDGTIHTDYSPEGSALAVLNAYDDGTLVYSTHAVKAEDGYTFKVPEEYRTVDFKIYYAQDKIYSVKLEEPAETVQPSESVSPEATASPAASAAPGNTAVPTVSAVPEKTAAPAATVKPTRTPYPAVYERDLDALHAPAVVESVSEGLIDGETYYVTTMLYQGREIVSNIRETALISSAPLVHSDLIGKTADYLREGDVIHFTCDLQGKIKSIEFIYRPDFADYINSGESYGSNFEQLVGTDKYSTFCFGVPVKTAKGYMLLANAEGKTADIDLSPETFVYRVSGSSRGKSVELVGTGYAPINKTYIQSSNFDADDNVISWSEADELTYALARVVNGTATEVIVFEN